MITISYKLNWKNKVFKLFQLPKDSKRRLSEFLDEKSKWNLYMTSREWRSPVLRRTNFVIGSSVKSEEVPAILKHFQYCYGKPIGLEFKNPNIVTVENFGGISFLTNLTSLRLPVRPSGLSTQDITPLLTSLSNLQLLECAKTSEAAKLPNLTYLAAKWFAMKYQYPKLRDLYIEAHGYPGQINWHLDHWTNSTVTRYSG